MQTLSAHLIEAIGLTPEQIQARSVEVSQAVTAWLKHKGADDPTKSQGEFSSLTKEGNGRFTREVISSEKGAVTETRLEEASRSGQTFLTTVWVVTSQAKISVYCTLNVKNTVSVIAPVVTDPRCPSVLRDILNLYSDWTFGGKPVEILPQAVVESQDEAQALIAEIRSQDRKLPIVVVSQNDGEPIWPFVDKDLANDLAGLATVVTIAEDASWDLTDSLGKQHSCYMGAIRLYWPARSASEGQLQSTVWTASMLLSNDKDGKGKLRFRSAVRKTVMSVAALTIIPPIEIREIQAAVAREKLTRMEQTASANTEELAMARLYADDNEELRTRLNDAQEIIASLSNRVAIAESSLFQAKNAELNAGQTPAIEEDAAPASGDIRFYKKHHNKPGYDVLIRIDDCGHSSWQNASKAEKAKKGVEHLEKSNDWKLIQHCGTCTGGGTWKVKW
jgi:hypothetical protein